MKLTARLNLIILILFILLFAFVTKGAANEESGKAVDFIYKNKISVLGLLPVSEDVDCKYLICGEAIDLMDYQFKVYKVTLDYYYPYDAGEVRESDKHPPKFIFSKRMRHFTPMEIESIPNGFVVTWFPGAGKSKLHIVYMETGENLKEVFSSIYDYMEVVYEKGNMNIPHLFCSNVYFKGEDDKGRITEVYETDVYKFDKKQAKYVIIKKIKYDSKHKFADRFKLAGLKYYQFTRFRWLK